MLYDEDPNVLNPKTYEPGQQKAIQLLGLYSDAITVIYGLTRINDKGKAVFIELPLPVVCMNQKELTQEDKALREQFLGYLTACAVHRKS